jgi:hypothetical protein
MQKIEREQFPARSWREAGLMGPSTLWLEVCIGVREVRSQGSGKA